MGTLRMIAGIHLLFLVAGTLPLAAALSRADVVNLLAREGGLHVSSADVQLQVAPEGCGEMHVAGVRRFGTTIEVTLRCSLLKVPLLALVRSDATFRPQLIAGKFSSAIPVIVRRGAVVQLSFESDGGRLTVPAVALEKGRGGERIRVRVRGTRQVRLARVPEPKGAKP